MTFRVACRFEDGVEIVVDADEFETVCAAALRQDLPLLTDCREGACATCKAHCPEGEYRLVDCSPDALSAEEEDARWVLACQMQVASDCVIDFPYPSSMVRGGGVQTRRARVTAVERVAADTVRLEVADTGTGAGGFDFQPGQYVDIRVPGSTATRSFSFSTPPSAAPRYEFFVRLLERGLMTDWLRERAAAGDELELIGPLGAFFLRPPRAPILMVSGGTGLAPMLAMLDRLLELPARPPVRLLHGAARPADLFALDRLEGRRAAGLDLDVTLVVQAPDPGWTGAVGLVTDHLYPGTIGSGDVDAYLCGPPPMIDAAAAKLSGFGLPPARIHTEKFRPS